MTKQNSGVCVVRAGVNGERLYGFKCAVYDITTREWIVVRVSGLWALRRKPFRANAAYATRIPATRVWSEEVVTRWPRRRPVTWHLCFEDDGGEG